VFISLSLPPSLPPSLPSITRQAFLKILHHYQEEQRNIMDVLEQVRALPPSLAPLLPPSVSLLPSFSC